MADNEYRCLCCGRNLDTIKDNHIDSLVSDMDFPSDDMMPSRGDFISYFNYKGIKIKEGTKICAGCMLSHEDSCIKFKKDGQNEDLKLKEE